MAPVGRPDKSRPAAAWAIPLLAVVATSVYNFAAVRLPPTADSAAYVAWVGTLLGLAWAGLRSTGSRLASLGLGGSARVSRGVVLGGAAAALYFVVSLQPGFYLGFAWQLLPKGWTAAALLVLTPLLALATTVLFLGLLLRELTRRHSFVVGLAASSLAFGAGLTNFAVVLQYGPTATGVYALLSFLVASSIGLTMGVLYYKTNWNLTAPVVLAAGVLVGTIFVPVAPAYLTPFEQAAFGLLAWVVVLAVITIGIRESPLLARRYLGVRSGPRKDRFLRRRRWTRSASGSLVALGIGAVAILVILGLLVGLLGSPNPTLAVASDSMVPTLHRGDLVVVQHVAASQVEIGAIIVFSSPCLPGPTIHRVVAVESTGAESPEYETKGDANSAPDPCLVPFDSVEGKVVAVLPAMGYLALYPIVSVGLAAGLATVLLLIPSRHQRFPRRYSR